MAKVAQLHDNLDRTKYYDLQRENVIGRSPDVSIHFENKSVSRRHAKIAQPPGSDAFYIEDISARGVYVNFRRIRGRHPLKPGDRICIVRFRNIHPIELERMTERDLKECCDDARNEGVVAVVDLMFQIVDVEETKTEGAPEPKGFLEKLKALFSRR